MAQILVATLVSLAVGYTVTPSITKVAGMYIGESLVGAWWAYMPIHEDNSSALTATVG
jgi:hypothetical protein